MAQRLLEVYGRHIGRRPWVGALIGLTVTVGLSFGWLELLRRNPLSKEEDLELMWSIKGGRLEKEIKTVKEFQNKDPWEQKAIVTYALGRGPLKDADVARSDFMEELLTLFKRFHNISVTTKSGLTYTTHDLCARGSIPDASSASPMFPCLVISPLDCFSEYTEALHPSYVQLDKMIDLIFPPAFMATPYATRTSFRTSNPEQIRAEIGKKRFGGLQGCPWWLGAVIFQTTVLGGDLEWNPNRSVLTKVGAFRFIFFMEGPRRAAFRMSLSKPKHTNENDIREALDLFDEAWNSEVEAADARSERVEVANMGMNTVENVNEGLNKPPWVLLITGGCLMNLFINAVFASFRYPLLSRIGVASLGLFPVGLSIGASGGLILLSGMTLNPAMITCLPFLALGLGVDDLFVLIRTLSGLGIDFITENSNSAVIAEVFKRAGVGVTLTSICNVCAFGAGAMLPVPAMSDFCISASITSGMNYLTMMLVIPALLAQEATRIRKRKPEMIGPAGLCHRRLLKRAAEEGKELKELSPEGVVTGATLVNFFLKRRLAPFIYQPVVRVSITLLAVGFICLSVWSIMNKAVGYQPSEIVSTDSKLHRSFELSFDKFTLFPAQLCFVDTDVPSMQKEMLTLYDNITAIGKAQPGDTLPYLSAFYYYLYGQSSKGWTLDSSWKQPSWAPFGIATSNSSLFYQQWASFVKIPLDNASLALLPQNQAFANADVTGAFEFSYVGDTADTPLKFSYFRFYQINLIDNVDYIDSVKQLRSIIDASPLKDKAFAYGGIITFWSVFLELEGVMLQAVAIDLGVIFFITLVLMRSFRAAFLSTAASCMIVLEVYGLCMLFLEYNIFIAAALLASAGISVEFTAHLIASFYLETEHAGSPRSRLSKVLSEVGPPVLQGSMSTMVSILPLAFSPIPFITKYMFAPFALVVAVGMFNGLLVLPALLVLFGGCFTFQGQETDGWEEQDAAQREASAIARQMRPSSLPTALARFTRGGHPDLANSAAVDAKKPADAPQDDDGNGGVVGI
jgi:hypothetical protein